jgi:hypothetical protein
VFHLHSHFTDTDALVQIQEQCRQASIGCVECKTKLADSINRLLDPYREKRQALTDEEILDVLQKGKEEAKRSAQQVIQEVRHAIGLHMFERSARSENLVKSLGNGTKIYFLYIPLFLSGSRTCYNGLVTTVSMARPNIDLELGVNQK